MISVCLDFLNEHIEYLQNIAGTGRKDQVEEATINSYRNLVPIFKRFEEAKHTLIFEKLDEKTYKDIWEISNKIRTGVIKINSYKLSARTPYKTNTLKSYQTYFIKLCKLASKNGVIIPLDLTDENLINRAEKERSKKTNAYLTEDDLIKILNYTPSSDSLILAKNYIIIA